MKEVTVVIPNYKGEAYLRPCVESLLAGTGLEMDVIIVDNGSRDGCVEEVRRLYPQVECVCLDQNYGFCKAVNIGIRKAETPYVFLLNNDTLVCKGAVEALLASLKKDRRIFSVEAKMIQYQDRTKIDSAGTFYNAFGWAYARGRTGRRISTGKGDLSFPPAQAPRCTGERFLKKSVCLMKSILPIWKMWTWATGPGSPDTAMSMSRWPGSSMWEALPAVPGIMSLKYGCLPETTCI